MSVERWDAEEEWESSEQNRDSGATMHAGRMPSKYSNAATNYGLHAKFRPFRRLLYTRNERQFQEKLFV